ncbi:hypothetical protein ATCC90586_009216 [Pythium insidiosum]|nr:hypothetical protein ATCC90586_009216 [Pythium insidiosum]
MEHDEATAFAANAKTKGNHYFQRGHWEAAYRQYSNGINAEGPVDPDLLAQLHSNRAATCLHLNRTREARKEAKRATALAPLWPKAHIRLAETYHATRKYDKAASRLETALGLAKESLDSAASREIRNKLDAYRLDRDDYEHGHSENRSYDPRFVDEDPLSEAFRSQMGLPDDGPSPSAFVDELLQRVPESESTGAQRNVVIGHRARTRGDDVAAAEAFRSAALQGNPEGMYNYAVMLQAGHGVQQILEESFRWFERAAVCPPNAFAVFPYVGICDAMAALGRCYSLGIVVEKDERKASYAAEANRIDDAPLVFSPDEVIQSRTAAALLAISGQWDADLALLMYPRDPDRLVGYWMAAHASFPDDPVIALRAGSMCMFDSLKGSDSRVGRKIFRDLHARLAANRPGDQGQYVGVLYSLAAASFHAWDLEEANARCKSFLAVAEPDGHRKANEGHFMLGLITLRLKDKQVSLTGNNKKKMKKGQHKKMQLARSMALAAEHLEQGVRLSERLPEFLRGEHEKSDTFHLLNICVAAYNAEHEPKTSNRCENRGGDVLSGPHRHPTLYADMPELLVKMRKELALMKSRVISLGSLGVPLSLTPGKQSRGGRRQRSLRPASIIELLCSMKDHVFEDHSVECVVVSTVCFTGSSHMFIVEDSKREPIRTAVYNAGASLVKQLVPGRRLTLLGPYLRYPRDGSFLFRVDHPSETLVLGELEAMCWNCLAVAHDQRRLQRCGKCNVARYCVVDRHAIFAVNRDAMSRKLMTKFSGSSGAMAATTQAVPMRSGSILALAIGVAAVVGVSALHKRRLLRSEGDIAADSAVAGRSDGNASAGGSEAGRQRDAQVAVGLLRLCVPRHWTDLVKNDVFIDKTMAQVAETLIIFVDGHDKHEILNYASELYNMAWDVACVKGKLSLDIRIVAGVAGEGMPTWDALLLLPELNAVFGEEDHVNVQQMNAARLERDGLFAVAYHPLARFAQPYLRAELRYFEDEHTPLTLQDQILLGGTFDHLHNGHKKLLSLAVSVCRRHLIVGITSEAMLRHKANAELIESLETRQRNVLAFVHFLKPSLRVEFAVLEDPFGPAIQVDGPAGLVLSTETLPALPKIESIRRERGLAPLTAYVCRRTDASTLSSSFIRERLAASRVPAPK